jgi:hypothetical protein
MTGRCPYFILGAGEKKRGKDKTRSLAKHGNWITLNQTGCFQICVKGVLDPQWSDWFDEFKITQINNDSLLTGKVEDQAALHGVIGKIRDLGLTLIFVKPVDSASASCESKCLKSNMEEQKTTIQPSTNVSIRSKVERPGIGSSLQRMVEIRIRAYAQLPSPNQQTSIRIQRKNKHPHSTKKHK